MGSWAPALHHLALRVSDLDACVTFWAERVGLQVTARHHTPTGALRAVWLGLGDGAILMLEQAEGQRTGPTMGAGGFVWALAIPADARAARRRALVAQGVSIVHETAYTFYVEDPEGNRLGFSHYPVPQAEAPTKG